jgi:hypothetical protein
VMAELVHEGKVRWVDAPARIAEESARSQLPVGLECAVCPAYLNPSTTLNVADVRGRRSLRAAIGATTDGAAVLLAYGCSRQAGAVGGCSERSSLSPGAFRPPPLRSMTGLRSGKW